MKIGQKYVICGASYSTLIMNRCSAFILAKYSYYYELNDHIITIVEEPDKTRKNDVKVCLENEPHCWFLIGKLFLKPLEVKHKTKCKCDLWITGCKCGVFLKEQGIQ